MDIKSGDAAAIIQAAREGQEPKLMDVGLDGLKVPVLLVPNGNGGIGIQQLKAFIDPWRERPERRAGIATLADLDSFIEHAARFKDPDSAVFIVPAGDDDDPPTFLSVLDYHEAVSTHGASEAEPRFGKHRGSYTPAFSKEWEAWSEANGSELSQGAFSKLVEDNAADVFDIDEHHPEALGDLSKWFAARFGGKLVRDGGAGAFYASCQTLLDVAEKLAVTVTDRVGESAWRTTTGTTAITFESEVTTSVEVPAALVIAIPVFDGGDLYQIPARLRVTLRREGDSKRTQWQVDLYGVERTLRAAIDDAKTKVAEKLGLPIFVGSPEP